MGAALRNDSIGRCNFFSHSLMSYRCRIRVLYCKKVAKMRYVYVAFYSCSPTNLQLFFVVFLWIFVIFRYIYIDFFFIVIVLSFCWLVVVFFSVEKIGILYSRWSFYCKISIFVSPIKPFVYFVICDRFSWLLRIGLLTVPWAYFCIAPMDLINDYEAKIVRCSSFYFAISWFLHLE